MHNPGAYYIFSYSFFFYRSFPVYFTRRWCRRVFELFKKKKEPEDFGTVTTGFSFTSSRARSYGYRLPLVHIPLEALLKQIYEYDLA